MIQIVEKAETLFNGDIGYRVYRDGDTCKIEMKFSPKFHLVEDYNIYNPDTLLPNMPRKVITPSMLSIQLRYIFYVGI